MDAIPEFAAAPQSVPAEASRRGALTAQAVLRAALRILGRLRPDVAPLAVPQTDPAAAAMRRELARARLMEPRAAAASSFDRCKMG